MMLHHKIILALLLGGIFCTNPQAGTPQDINDGIASYSAGVGDVNLKNETPRPGDDLVAERVIPAANSNINNDPSNISQEPGGQDSILEPDKGKSKDENNNEENDDGGNNNEENDDGGNNNEENDDGGNYVATTYRKNSKESRGKDSDLGSGDEENLANVRQKYKETRRTMSAPRDNGIIVRDENESKDLYGASATNDQETAKKKKKKKSQATTKKQDNRAVSV